MTVAVCIDHNFTPAGEASLTAAIEEASSRAEDLMIVYFSRDGASTDNDRREEVLEQASRLASDAGVSASVLQPDPRRDLVTEFLHLAREIDASLIVVGMRQRIDVGNFILSNHSLRILLQADRPVLAVKSAQSPLSSVKQRRVQDP
ncbi:universal stress protein [Pseudarthrobacter sp. DSP2-3-2b1]|uniref:universal stress protein n=1 Tax=Pseudarthrobacter sp. DSP2-3-2b1 TaxID=2804661 RepID=UPI003CF2F08D